MYTEPLPDNVLPGQKVRIRYDCDGTSKWCGKDNTTLYRVAKKNADKHGGKHICRSCQLRANNPGTRDDVKAKIKKTIDDKYGGVMPMNNEQNIEERKKKFKDSDWLNQRLEKTKKTNLENFGVEHAMQCEEVKKRCRDAIFDSIGVEYPYQSPEIMDKMKAHNKEKFGVENVAQLKSTQEKMLHTRRERYGVDHYNQLPSMREYLRDNCKQWLADSYASGGPNKGITRPAEWNEKQRDTIVRLMHEGKWKAGYPRSKKGFCFPKHRCKKDQVYFRSSYEAIYCYYLDNNPDVEWFTFESFRIEYEYQGQKRYYVPDFLVQWSNPNQLSIIEIKAEFLIEDEKVQVKNERAIVFADTHGMDFRMISCEEIAALGIDYQHLIATGFVQPEDKE